MAIKNAEGLTQQEIMIGVQGGAKFVVFKYAVSILIMTFNPNSEVHYIRPGESTLRFSIGHSILTLVAGWWGVPWGPIYSISSLYHNMRGGKDVTSEVMSQIMSNTVPAAPTGTNTYNVPSNNTNNSGPYNVPGNNSSNQDSSPYNIR